MDQEKIGKFILELRKEKNMTQNDLANKIGVTDRAISKWENGRGLPDLSLMIPLCNELNITINELLSGERINKNNYQEKLEENILKTINYTDKRIKKNKYIFKIIFITLILLIMILITLFFVDVNRMNNNDPVIFSTWGFDYIPPVNLQNELIENSIIEYLINKSDNEIKHHDNEKSFVSMKIYLIEEKKDYLFYVYAWVLEEKYFLEGNDIKQDSGSSIPYKFIVEYKADKFYVIDYKIPRDGNYYAKDINDIFPKCIRDDIKIVYKDGTIERLMLDIRNQTKLYFHK